MATRNRNTDSGSSITPFLLGALAGGVIGASLALLFAPAEGVQIRQGIGEKFDDVTESINSILANAKTSAEKMINDGREKSDRIVGQARERASNLIEDADRTISEVRRRRTNGSAAANDSSMENDEEA